MATASVTSPSCTWLVCCCLHKQQPSLFQSSKRWVSKRRNLSGFISSFCGSLMNSCLVFEPPFGESLFSFSNTSSNRIARKQRRIAAHSGKSMVVTVQPSKEVSTESKPHSHTKQRQVVVTGMGVVTPLLGHEPDDFYTDLLEGVSGISDIDGFDCSSFPNVIFLAGGWVAPKLSKRADKFMLYMLTVMNELDKTRCVLIGSGMGGMKVFNDAIEALRISYKKMDTPFASTNMCSAMLAIDLGWMVPNYSISTAVPFSSFCILNAPNHITRGEADVMLWGGSDSVIIPSSLGGFVACRALSKRNEDQPKLHAIGNRDGFVMGEGAVVLLLEELDHAKKRGSTIYAEFIGGSYNSDAYHMTEPHPDGIKMSIVNYVYAHATSTEAGDLKEYQSIIRCFGQNPDLRVFSIKSVISHLLGAADVMEAVAGNMDGWVHPNVILENPEEGVSLVSLFWPKLQTTKSMNRQSCSWRIFTQYEPNLPQIC
ncbi:hypothetical protein MKW92_031430 [Papaver armeniacum]|nr:hypothetical protein MKW92_031430 [Papaver armeniacum]